MIRSTILAPLFALLTAAALAAPAFAVSTDFLFMWGSFGAADGQFKSPTELAIAPTGEVYVVDAGNARLQVFDAEGNFLAKWTSFNGFGAPRSVAVSPDGINIYVQATYRTIVYDVAQTYKRSWSGAGTSALSHQLTVDTNGVLYLTYWINGSSATRKFGLFGSGAVPATPASWGRIKGRYR